MLSAIASIYSTIIIQPFSFILSSTLFQLPAPIKSRRRKRASSRRTRHYYLHQKVLHRNWAHYFAAKRRCSPPTSSPSVFGRGTFNRIHNLSSTIVNKFKFLFRFLLPENRLFPHFDYDSSHESWSCFGESSLPSDEPTTFSYCSYSTNILDKFCSRFDFLQLHFLCSEFDISGSSSSANLVQSVNDELNRLGSILYTNDDPYSSEASSPSQYSYRVGPTCIFINNAVDQQLPIVIDSGASKSLSPLRSDFVTFKPQNSSIKGIGAHSEVKGVGNIRWKVIDQHGETFTFETEAYYVPSASIRLYSPQRHFMQHKSGSLHLTWNEVRLIPPHSDKALSFPFNQFSNLPLMLQCPSDEEGNHALVIEESLDKPTFQSDFFDTHQVEDPFYILDGTCVDTNSTSAPSILPPQVREGEIVNTVLDEKNFNLSRSQKELLAWHYKLGHIGMSKIQKLMHPYKDMDHNSTFEKLRRQPIVIETSNPKTHTCDLPKCAACTLSNMERLSPSTASFKGSNNEHSLKQNDLQPGQKLSMDQYVVSTKGRSLSNSSRNAEKYNGGTIFVDHASGKIFNFHQISLRAGETIQSKKKLERCARRDGITIENLHGDNGVFKSMEFRSDCELMKQQLSFSGVGAKHQNGVAERNIKTISYLARANLIHSAISWPEQHNLELWPFAFDHSVYVFNNIPNSDGLAPEEKWSGIKFNNYNHVQRLHPWGCPSYVLDPVMQDGKKLPKWKPRSRQGKFLGFSKEHASSVGLILNPRTKRISPQFHLLYDDFFSTVQSIDANDIPTMSEGDWDSLIRQGTDMYYDPHERDPSLQPPPVSDEWLEPDEINRHNELRQDQRERARVHRDQQRRLQQLQQNPPSNAAPAPAVAPPPVPPAALRNPVDTPFNVPRPALEPPATPGNHRHQRERNTPPQPTVIEVDDDSDDEGSTDIEMPPAEEPDASDLPAPPSLPPRRSRKPNRKFFGDEWVTIMEKLQEDDVDALQSLDLDRLSTFTSEEAAYNCLRKKYRQADRDQEFLQTLDWAQSMSDLADQETDFQSKQLFSMLRSYEDEGLGLLEEHHPLAFITKANAADNPNWYQATNGENSDGFWEAMWKEIMTLQKIGAWEQVKKDEEMNVVPSTWAFKIKRFPSGLVRKLKARFCVRGDMQKKGIDVFETFAPVVSWTTVRLLLILSVILDLKSTQVDYTAAFVQAPIDTNVFISLPKGWEHLNRMGLLEDFKPGHVLKLKRSQYGMCQSPRNFFNHLKGNLQKSGFKQSKNDPCLFFSDKVVCLVYVDDCLFFSKNQKDIDESIKRIQATGMNLGVEADAAGFLGISIKRTDEGVELTQTGLIDRVVTALGLDDANPKLSSAPKKPLGRDLAGSPFSQEFNYASVVGMMMYLCNNSRPDIAFAVSQCARYTHSPTELHGIMYLKHIGKYLKGTRDKGLILNPTSSKLDIECFVDADFAGLWNSEDEQDPHCVRSRTGFVILIAGCPVLWKSKLQTEIALSTMESEYIALSQSCRELLPLQALVTEVGALLHMPEGDETMHVKSTVFEDNEPCLKLANMEELPRMTNRSKHIAIKYHWFRSHVGNELTVSPIASEDQLADIFTKSPGLPIFEKLRKRLMGW